MGPCPDCWVRFSEGQPPLGVAIERDACDNESAVLLSGAIAPDVVESHMKTRIVAGTRFLGLLALAVACSSTEQGDGSNGGGAGPVGGGGTNAAGSATGGASGTGVTGGTSGTAGSGVSGSATGGTAGVSSG